MTARRYLPWTLGAALLGTGVWLLARNGGKPPAPSAVASPTSPVAGIRCEGRVAAHPGADVVLAAEVGGRVMTLDVKELDRVRAGQVIARLDDREQVAALAAARARVVELQADARFAELEQVRMKRLVKEGAVGQRTFDEADSRLNLAVARKDAAAAQVTQLEAALSKLTVRAPFAGTVVERMAHPGELQTPAAHLVRVVDLDRLRVEAEVDEYDLGRLAVGAPVTIEAEGLAERWEGRVEEVPRAVAQRRLKSLDPSRPTDIRVALVKVSLPAGAPLKLGQRVELVIRAPR